MTTPLTDAVVHENRIKPVTTGYLAMTAHAEKLELDRQSLIDFAEMVHRDSSSSRLRREAMTVIRAARATFQKP